MGTVSSAIGLILSDFFPLFVDVLSQYLYICHEIYPVDKNR